MKASRTPQSKPLLVEIGCEEIPARFLSEAERSFAGSLQAALQEAELLAPLAPAVQSYSTPRRFLAWVPELRDRQPNKMEEVLGPSIKVGLDSQGKPTLAAESFAARKGASVEDLVRVSTSKGEYLALRKTVPGRPARELLPAIVPRAIATLSFLKSMYWLAKSGPRFIRPIRWLLALWGEGNDAVTIRFEFAGIKAGNLTYGRRGVRRESFRVRSFQEYSKRLRGLQVEIDPERRREKVWKESQVLLEELNLSVLEDKGLEDWVVNSCEWPRALLGRFNPRYLNLPQEILVAVMRDHQKYFAVRDRSGSLQPFFITILNTNGDPKGWIREGHERVLEARFADAEFFWKADQQLKLQDRQELLAKVIYEAELGNYADKVRRMKGIASELGGMLEAQGRFGAADRSLVRRAVELSKCDLTTQMVKEFPELQGIVGGLYARAQGEERAVFEAIYDHYLPQGLEDRCPRMHIGALVSLADKIDSVAGGFAVGHAPTSSSDPFGLRRQANGIIKVLLELLLPLNLRQAVGHALGTLNIEWRKPQSEVFSEVMDFLGDRLRYYLEAVRNLRYDTVRAIIAAGWEVPTDMLRRAEALEKIRDGENFKALSVAAKRIKNILTKSATGSDWQGGEVEDSAFKEASEGELYRAYLEAAHQAKALGELGNYEKALEVIAGLRPTVDRFFDNVLVMTEDSTLRINRLRLLWKLDQLFSGLAQFAAIATSPANVGASTSKPVTP